MTPGSRSPITVNVSRAVIAAALLLTATPLVEAQPGVLTPQQLIEYTPEWKGERFPDGRPKVPDAILEPHRQADRSITFATFRSVPPASS